MACKLRYGKDDNLNAKETKALEKFTGMMPMKIKFDSFCKICEDGNFQLIFTFIQKQ